MKKSFVLDDCVAGPYYHEMCLVWACFYFPCVFVTCYGVKKLLFTSDESGGSPGCEKRDVVRV